VKNERKKSRATLAEVQNMKGKTQWTKLLTGEKSTNKKVQPTKKCAPDFGVNFQGETCKKK
jgi:hypothetical protein